MKVEVEVETPISRSPRARQLEGMFDVPPSEKAKLSWNVNVPLDERDWNVGLIVGPSGCGKTTLASRMFGDEALSDPFEWGGAGVVDDFADTLSMQDIARTCTAVGFNTIPAWMRPYACLSNGEQFRVTLARTLLERASPIVFDEFTSVVDRQVAKIGSHCVQKHVRRTGKQFVAVTCHHDVEEWLQPDWVLEPAGGGTFRWRSLQPRPAIDFQLSVIDHAAWGIFAPYHYMSAELHRSAACFGGFVDGRLAGFVGILHRPNKHTDRTPIAGNSRGVTLPDYQGIGVMSTMNELLGSAFRTLGVRYRLYPAHPILVRTYDKSEKWAMKKRPGTFSPAQGKTSKMPGGFGGRPCAVFEWCGPKMGEQDAVTLLSGKPDAFWHNTPVARAVRRRLAE